MSLDRRALLSSSYHKGAMTGSQNNDDDTIESNTDLHVAFHTKHDLLAVVEEGAEQNAFGKDNTSRGGAVIISTRKEQVELERLRDRIDPKSALEKKDTFVLPNMRNGEEIDALESVDIDQQIGDEEVEEEIPDEVDASNQEVDEQEVDMSAKKGSTFKDGSSRGSSIESCSSSEVEEDSDNNNQSSSARVVPVRLPSLLSVTVAEPKKKGIQEPRPPRNGGNSASKKESISSVSTSGRGDRKSRSKKFQFPDAELLNLMLEEEKGTAASPASSSSSTNAVNRTARRRFSAVAAMTTTVPLRRKSFSLTKGTGLVKPLPSIEERMVPPPLTSTSRLHTRRQSASACYPRSRRSSIRSPAPFSLPNHHTTTKPSTISTSSQMVVRVRERKLDGVPEIVISKRFTRPALVWHWQDRQLHLPFFGTIIPLGPHQHGVMLRQLRYVKSVMHEFPWAKTHLKDMLALYTKKEMTKEELYPQLNLLSTQVTDDRLFNMKKQQQLIVKKQKLTTQLSVATTVMNELNCIKYGRRGKPHETKLYYDPGQPTTLHWIRKNGELSREFLEVDQIQIQFYDSTRECTGTSSSLLKAMKKFPQSVGSDACLSLVTPLRTLDLQLKSALHREWLVNALTDIISFAQQYKAAGVKRETTVVASSVAIAPRSVGSPQGTTHVLRRM